MEYDKLSKAELIRRLQELEQAAPGDAQRLLHDLQVHQIELEAQNVELREAQQQLEESRERYVELYDFAPVGYVTLDDGGVILQINLTGAAMLGMERGKLQGSPFRSHLAARQAPVFREYLDRVFGEGTERHRHTACLTRRDGAIVNVRIESVLAYYDSKVCCLSALIDISEQLQLEARLRDHTQQLLEADKRKDHFLAMLAHELRNPLAPIQNAVQVMRLRAAKDPATVDWALDLISRQLNHLTRLVDDLLDVERLVHGKIRFEKKAVDLVALVNQTIENNTSAQTLHRRLSVLLPAESVTVNADATRLTQVIENLLVNAAHGTAGSGGVTVSVVREGGEAKLKIADTGIGIDPGILPHIFEPFVQGDPARGGLGLGLALVQQLVREHGGSVSAESAGHGRGSTFTVRLPIFGESPQTLAGASARVGKDGQRRVLVVEDNRDIAESLTALLNGMGHAVETVYDGESALVAAPNFDPDIVFVDLALPGIDGFEVARRLRAAPTGRPMTLVAFTGFGGDDVNQRVRAAGFDAHLLKPGTIQALAGVLA